MTYLLTLLLTVNAIYSARVFADTNMQPKLVATAYDKTYIPNGFDDNDRVQIVAEGLFANTCYRPAPANVVINTPSKTITLSPSAFYYSGMCLMVLVPYDQVLNLGILPHGHYTVLQSGERKPLAEFDIRKAISPNADDYLYAPISQAYYHRVAHQNVVTISGSFTNSCLHLENVKVTTQPDVIVIQPIAEVTERNDCKQGVFPFEKSVNVGDLKAGRYLLHVRSLNGQAVNSIVFVPDFVPTVP